MSSTSVLCMLSLPCSVLVMSSVSFGTCTAWSSALWLKLQSPQLVWLFYLSFGYVNFGEVVFHSRWTVNTSMCGVVCHIRTCTLGGLECIMSHMMSRLLVICTSYSLTRGPLPSLTGAWCFAANTHLDDILLLRKSMEPFSLCGDRWRVYQWPTWLLFLFPLSGNSSAAKAEVCRNLQRCSLAELVLLCNFHVPCAHTFSLLWVKTEALLHALSPQVIKPQLLSLLCAFGISEKKFYLLMFIYKDITDLHLSGFGLCG